MTDHSTLAPGLPEMPFQAEARLITRVLTFFGTTAPKVITAAVAARNLFNTVDGFNDAQLAKLGIARSGIAAYIVKKSGLLDL